MKKNNLKKIIGGVVLTCMIGIGFSVAGNLNALANNVSVMDKECVSCDMEESFGYKPYGISPNGTKIFETKDQINSYVKDGILTPKEGELEIKFLEAKNDDEKDMIFKEIISVSKDAFGFTDEQADMIKNGGYKNFNENLDKVYYIDLVKDGILTQEEADIEYKYYGAKNKEERQAAYVLLVNNLVKKGEITAEEAEKFKNDGYEKFIYNMDIIDFNKTLKEMVDAGFITQNKADELKNRNDDEKYIELYDLHDKYQVQVDLKAGNITQEEADLLNKLYDAKTEEEEVMVYNQLLELDVKAGVLTQQEADQMKH